MRLATGRSPGVRLRYVISAPHRRDRAAGPFESRIASLAVCIGFPDALHGIAETPQHGVGGLLFGTGHFQEPLEEFFVRLPTPRRRSAGVPVPHRRVGDGVAAVPHTFGHPVSGEVRRGSLPQPSQLFGEVARCDDRTQRLGDLVKKPVEVIRHEVTVASFRRSCHELNSTWNMPP